MFAGNFAPAGWMMCEGQLLPISENETLFQLIGTTYGGDGQTTFALPDMQSRVPIHQGNGFILAETGGAEQITLTVPQIPGHTHALLGSAVNGSQPSPGGNLLANSTVVTPYAPETPNQGMAATSITAVGGSQPHDNLQPYGCFNYIISLFGIFPSQT
jgi:microcystin-dependent protein